MLYAICPFSLTIQSENVSPSRESVSLGGKVYGTGESHECMRNYVVEQLSYHTFATLQNGQAELWQKSRGTRIIALHGHNWCEVLRGRLIVIPN